MPLLYWRENHFDELNNAKSYNELNVIAIDIINSMPQPIGQVCGPISSGGYGSIEKNLEIFDRTIKKLIGRGENIFNQMPLQEYIAELNGKSSGSKDEKNRRILEEIYLPIFESNLIKKMYFMSNWKSSYGANWERRQALRLGINMVDLPEDFID